MPFSEPLEKTLWRRLIFDNNKAGYDKLITQVNSLCAQHRLSKIVFGIEPTGNYHKPLASWLIQKEFMVVLVSGKAVSDNRDLLNGRWDKNDTKDSANVADLAGRGKCQFYDNPGPEIMALRNLLSLRKRLKREEHSIRMRIRNSLLAKSSLRWIVTGAVRWKKIWRSLNGIWILKKQPPLILIHLSAMSPKPIEGDASNPPSEGYL